MAETHHVEVADIPGKGKGVRATVPIAAGTEILRISTSFCWPRRQDAYKQLSSSAGADESQTEAELEDLSDEGVLALWLLNERGRVANGESSNFAEHIGMLPEALDGVLLWDESEMTELAGTCFHEAATGLREETQTEWTYLQSLRSWAARLDTLGSETDFVMAKAQVVSRQLEFEEGLKVVPPTLDMLNHSSTPNCAVEVDAAGGADDLCLVVRCSSPVDAGEECCIAYGPLPNASLLISYGFTLEENPYDCVEAVLSFPLPAERRPVLRNLAGAGQRLAAEGAPICPFELLVDADEASEANGVFVTRHNLTRASPLPPTLLATVRLQLLERSELDGANILCNPGTLAVPGEPKCVQQAQKCLQQLLAGHSTKAEDDKAILESSRSPSRLKMAAGVRLAEKEILSAAIAQLSL